MGYLDHNVDYRFALWMAQVANWIGKLRNRPLLISLLWLLPLGFLAAHAARIPYQPGSLYSDFEIAHMANAEFLRHSLFSMGEFPLWSPLLMGGYPFHADPLAGLFYVPGWLGYLLPQPIGLNLLVMLHFTWLAFGTARLGRRLGLSAAFSVGAGLLVLLMPKIWAHYAAGHVSLLFAFSWTPWIAAAGMRTSGSTWFGRQTALSALILALGICADPRWAPYLILVFTAAYYFANRSVSPLSGLQSLGRAALISGIAVGLAAALVLPMLNFAARSTRSLMTVDDLLQFALRPADLIKVMIPVFADQAERAIYIGFPVLLIGWVGWRGIGKKHIRVGLVFLAAMLILFSLGGAFPPNRWLVQLPGFDLLRVPSRAWLLLGWGACMLAAVGLDQLSKSYSAIPAAGKLIVVAVALLMAGLALGAWAISGEVVWGLIQIAIVAVLAAVVLLLGKKINSRLAAALLSTLLVLDFGIYALSAVEFRPRSAIPEEILAVFSKNDRPVRIYSPTFSLPQSAAASQGLELAGGVSPLILTVYAADFLPATGAWAGGYSVTLPPVPGGDPLDNPTALSPDPAKLGEMNVGWVVSEKPLINTDAYRLVFSTANMFVYEVRDARTRAEWVDSQGKTSPASITDYRNNRIEIDVDGPGVLTLRQTWYPGWNVKIDGARAALDLQGIFQGVTVGAGHHQVEFYYNPMDLWISLGITLIFLAFTGVLWRRK